jgi:hypothetical protein
MAVIIFGVFPSDADAAGFGSKAKSAACSVVWSVLKFSRIRHSPAMRADRQQRTNTSKGGSSKACRETVGPNSSPRRSLEIPVPGIRHLMFPSMIDFTATQQKTQRHNSAASRQCMKLKHAQQQETARRMTRPILVGQRFPGGFCF